MNIRKILDFKISANSLSMKGFGGIFAKIGNYWFRHYRIFFSMVFVMTLGAGIYLWYESVYNSGWNDAEKQQYINSQKIETGFKSDKFNAVIGEIEDRRVIYNGEYDQVKEIFRQTQQ